MRTPQTQHTDVDPAASGAEALPYSESPEDDLAASWWCVTNERLAAVAGALGWVMVALAFVAALAQRSLLTILAILVLAAVGMEASSWRSMRTRIALVVATQVILVVFLAGRL